MREPGAGGTRRRVAVGRLGRDYWLALRPWLAFFLRRARFFRARLDMYVVLLSVLLACVRVANALLARAPVAYAAGQFKPG
ncbi:hypothetical protein GCM10010442_44760 [Kitasatospora kifunensis]